MTKAIMTGDHAVARAAVRPVGAVIDASGALCARRRGRSGRVVTPTDAARNRRGPETGEPRTDVLPSTQG
ncbi:hypothetical protein EDD29_5418 [Actinocorallia herbida]|uniref:Uncharacterized protein n=1 Tax=Actinocorallia herbida TaxID=58109 RepID=A0A3N1D2L8_9ACTN|nr:hypothetical protein [Actinocorallia herbida]ROO87779.1 hypothetical protein EDD29_5418 [Actinocorallia herbida]